MPAGGNWSTPCTSGITYTLEAVIDAVANLTVIHDQIAAHAEVDGWPPILSSHQTFLETGQPLPRETSHQLDWASV